MKTIRILSILSLLTAIVLIFWHLGRKSEQKSDEVFLRGVSPIAYVSTRDHVVNGEYLGQHNPYDYDLVGNIPGWGSEPNKPSDLVIVEHGLNNDSVKAINRFGLARESLRHNGFKGEVIGFEWAGSTNIDPWGATGFREARRNAEASGPKLARFLADYHEHSPKTRLHLIGYSMGAKIALEAALSLLTDPSYAKSSWKIDSIHLVGAAVPYESVSLTGQYGKAVESRVGKLFNYYSPNDSKLGNIFKIIELDRALGRVDTAGLKDVPRNYISRNVSSELPGVGKGGMIDPSKPTGRNHSAYLGVRDDSGKWLDDGALNVVASEISRL